MVWATLGPRTPDAPTLLAAAATGTSGIGLGTAIVPTYPRHPAVLASQMLVLAGIAPDRFRLGIGPSHRSIIETQFGLPMGSTMAHFREYASILRELLWEGRCDVDGKYYSVHLSLGQTARIPIYFSALRPRAFEVAGALADGVISWLCPISYLQEQAIPALRRGADRANHETPRVVAQVPVVMTSDRDVMLAAARPQVSIYSRLPFYAAMFQRAGFHVDLHREASDSLVEHLIVWGNDEHIEHQLRCLLGDGIDELAVTLISAIDRTEEDNRLANVIAKIHMT